MVPTACPFPSVDGLPSREPSKDRDPTENQSELATAVTGARTPYSCSFLRVQESRAGAGASPRSPESSALLEALPGEIRY